MEENQIILSVKDRFGRNILLSSKSYDHILKRPEMQGQEDKIKQTLSDPDEVRRSLKDRKVLLYYKYFRNTPVSEKYMAVVAKVLNKVGTIITSYFTDRIKKGEVVWRKG